MVLLLDDNSEIVLQVNIKLSFGLFDLFKVFSKIKSSYKSVLFPEKTYIFLHTCATCFKIPSNISTMTEYYRISENWIFQSGSRG